MWYHLVVVVPVMYWMIVSQKLLSMQWHRQVNLKHLWVTRQSLCSSWEKGKSICSVWEKRKSVTNVLIEKRIYVKHSIYGSVWWHMEIVIWNSTSHSNLIWMSKLDGTDIMINNCGGKLNKSKLYDGSIRSNDVRLCVYVKMNIWYIWYT